MKYLLVVASYMVSKNSALDYTCDWLFDSGLVFDMRTQDRSGVFGLESALRRLLMRRSGGSRTRSPLLFLCNLNHLARVWDCMNPQT